MTYWRIKEPTELPLAFFLHLLGPEGNIVAQYDGLAACPIPGRPVICCCSYTR